ncbi:toll/interleukin-1 receptor domain-containing protein [Massilia violaceinigra]|uniref:Toll/interleukin-1 receptor domain-containing protein n=1 Tax=Massilia violaceinigra TaxID=2045208 RepID=A0ABY4ABJ2_9BURK|nr:toll/interleukin-1 receptor domain-containing protein [Massilia violaceinigra]UOD32165.1 toll/interleukin-1 receptor domain-containing protein [Massilia violaceinigra]
MTSIFLSHSHADKEFARKLGSDLRRFGFGVWIDEAEINIGDSLIAKIREGLDQVDYVAAILSKASIASQWVTRELDIASNREIQEERVLVLPLVLEIVELPGFLKGKFYGDFTDRENYDTSLGLLLRALGGASKVAAVPYEIEVLRAEVAAAREKAAHYAAQLDGHQKLALRGKTPALIASIKEINEKFPDHAVINTTHAFQVGDMPVTLDYLMWAIAKSQRKGAHPLESLLTMYGKWSDAEAMLEAYDNLLSN